MHTTRKTIRTTIIGLVGVTAMLLTSCGTETPDQQPAAPEATETAEAATTESTTTTEATTTSEAPEKDELRLHDGDVVTMADDAYDWGTGVVRPKFGGNREEEGSTNVRIDFESVPTSVFTFEAEDGCIVARVADPDFTDRLTYLEGPGFGTSTWEIDRPRAIEEDREFVEPPLMAEFRCPSLADKRDGLDDHKQQNDEFIAELEQGGFVGVGVQLHTDELELVERAEG